MGNLFGTDGIRGVANVDPMTAETALAIGRATAHICKQHTNRHRIVIGKDTRISGYMIENALTAGICSMGVDVLLVGPMPTPGIAFITHSMRADAGIVISASHNLYQDNGIKIFTREGYKLDDSVEDEIEELITTEKIKNIRPTAAEIGKATRIDDAIGRYIVFCKNTFPEDVSLEGMRIVLDCANGATYKVAPIIFTELDAEEVITINDKPNGTNINARSGALHPERLVSTVKRVSADVGLAFDGDGDRIQAVDENGNLLSGDHIIMIIAKQMKQANLLKNDLVVATPMSNFGFHKAMKEMGIDVKLAGVGDRYVLQMMRELDATLGGEDSGHIIFRNHHTTGDGIISALQLLAVMQKQGKCLSKLAADMRRAPQVLINVPVKSKPPVEEIEELQNAVREAEAKLKDTGRVLIRYSGTEPICRVMVESFDEEATTHIAENLARIVSKTIS